MNSLPRPSALLVTLSLCTLGCSPQGSGESSAGTPRAAREAARVPLGQVEREPSSGAPPQVLVVLVDDLGWELFRSAPTPHLDAMAAQGVTFTNFWSAPKCGPTRASLLTGRFHFRIGDGEMARRHGRRSLGLNELLLPEVLGPELCAAFGKWHLSSDPEHPNHSGFAHFAGTLDNLNNQSYSSWRKIVDGEQATSRTYPTTDVTNDAIASDA
ncbi:MAG: sulfatase-like hydrolase/transferase, partial [Planctomycetota bacterium]